MSTKRAVIILVCVCVVAYVGYRVFFGGEEDDPDYPSGLPDALMSATDVPALEPLTDQFRIVGPAEAALDQGCEGAGQLYDQFKTQAGTMADGPSAAGVVYSNEQQRVTTWVAYVPRERGMSFLSRLEGEVEACADSDEAPEGFGPLEDLGPSEFGYETPTWSPDLNDEPLSHHRILFAQVDDAMIMVESSATDEELLESIDPLELMPAAIEASERRNTRW